MQEANRWNQILNIQREIVFVYHQLSDYRSIMPDLEYSGDINYWDFMNLGDVDSDTREFVNEGILVVTAAIISDAFEGAGYQWFVHNLDEVRTRVEQYESQNDNLEKVKQILLSALSHLKGKKFGYGIPETHKIINEFEWIHSVIVVTYFRDRLARMI